MHARNLTVVRNGERLSGEVIYVYYTVASTSTEDAVSSDTTISLLDVKIFSYPLRYQ